MIAPVSIAPTKRSVKSCRCDFESLLPAIRRSVSYAFRQLHGHLREELIAEAIGSAYAAFVRLVRRGLESLIYPSALAKYAVRRVRDRRRIGSGRDSRDVLSELVQAQHGFTVRTLEGAGPSPFWPDQLLADRRATPAELVACKLDFQAWLKRLSAFKRRVAVTLAMGDSTKEAAKRFQVTVGRISQLRRELKANWELFQAVPMAT
jgi:hypothetical protein